VPDVFMKGISLMATATVLVPTTMPDLSVWYGDIVLATSSRIIIDDGQGRRAEYTGSFSYTSYSYEVYGTLDTVEEFRNGAKIYSVDNIGADAYQMYQAVMVYSDADLAARILLNGSDDISGSSGADIISSYAGNDVIRGLGGNDKLYGMSGNDTIDGGAGTDSALYAGSSSNFKLTLSASNVVIEDKRVGREGVDQLKDVEFLEFGETGQTINLAQLDGPAGLSEEAFESFIELYIAYFNRAPDAIGLNFWGTAYANGTTLEEIASLFIDQEETREAYPASLTNEEFAAAVYNNVLGRVPDQEGFDFWVDVLNSGTQGRDQFILSVLGGVQDESPDRVYLDSKIDVGAYFAVHKGMSDVVNASAAMDLIDGTDEGVGNAVSAIDSFYQDAIDPYNGEFILQLVGVLDNPFDLS